MTPTDRVVGTAAAVILATLTFLPGPATAQVPVNGDIAFARARPNSGDLDVYTVDPDTGAEIRLFRDGNFPTWNHDATRIAFVRVTRKTGRDIFVIDVGGRKATQLTDRPGDDVSPDWSPDSSQIVWESNNHIWVVDVADPTTAHSVVTEGSNSSPSWTPDGRILYSTDRDGDGTFNIHVMNADGSADIQLTGETLDKADETTPHSNGNQIVYARRAWFETNTDIWRMNSAGLFEELLFGNMAFDDDHPRWSPDGTKIAFECDINADFDSDICVMNPNGTGATTVTGLHPDFRPDWGVMAA